MIALANGKDRLPDRIEPSIRLVIPNTNGQCSTIPGNHTNRFLAALSRTSSGMRYIDELHCSSNNTAISTTMPIQCARFHVNSVCVPRSAAALRISLLLSLLSACARFIAVLLYRLVKD